MLFCLILLGLATAVSTAEAVRAPMGSVPLTILTPLLLAAGTGTTLLAFATSPRRQGNESLKERITGRGLIALGLLLGAQGVNVLAGLDVMGITQLQSAGSWTAAILPVLALSLVAIGTGAAAAAFRSRNSLRPGSEPVLKRLSPLARGTFILLGLALGVLGFTSLATLDSGLVPSLILVALGIVAGLFALFADSRGERSGEPVRKGISPRAGVSLALLVLAVVVLGGQGYRLLGGSSDGTALDAKKTSLEKPDASDQGVYAAPINHKGDTPGSPDAIDPDTLHRKSLEAELRLKEAEDKATEALDKVNDVTNKKTEWDTKFADLKKKLEEIQAELKQLRGSSGKPN
jgi:hypothetical protein